MPTVESERARMEAAMQREIERNPGSSNSSSSDARSGYQGIPKENPGEWRWVENRYLNSKPYMQRGVMQNSITGEKKMTPYRDIRNDKGQIQKSLLHPEGNAFRAKLNEDNGYTAWKKEQDRIAAEAAKAKAEAAAKAAADAKAQAAREAAAAARAEAARKAEEARRAEAAAKAKAEQEAAIAKAKADALAEAQRIAEAEAAKAAEAERVRLENEAMAKAAAAKIQAQQEAAAAAKAERERQKALKDKAEPTPTETTMPPVTGEPVQPQLPATPYEAKTAEVYNPPGYVEGEVAPTVEGTGTSSQALVTSPMMAKQMAMPTSGGTAVVNYSNDQGSIIPVTEVDGKPISYVPEGYRKMGMNQGGVVGYAKGGDSDSTLNAEYQLATKFLGYKGPKSRPALNDFMKASPGAAARMGKYQQAMMGMNQGGMIPQQAQIGQMQTLNYQQEDPRTLVSSRPEPVYNYTYDQAVSRNMARDVKSPAENAAIMAALNAGPSAESQYGPQAQMPFPTDKEPFNEPTQEEMIARLSKLKEREQSDPAFIPTPTRGPEYSVPAASDGTFSYDKDVVPAFGQAVQQTMQPIQAGVDYMQPLPTQDISTLAGQVGAAAPTATAATVPTVETANLPAYTPASTYSAATVSPYVMQQTAGLQAAQGAIPQEQQVQAQQGQLSAGATPTAPQFDPNFVAQVTSGELNVTPDQLVEAKGQDEVAPAAKIAESSGINPAIAQQATVSINELPQAAQIQESNMAQAQVAQSGGFLREEAVAYAAKLNSFNVDNGTLAQAIQGEVGPLGTVQGQLEGLMKQFDDGTPAWAAGALRAANATMASRGLAGSSMAGSAILQAAMESALPIAAQDAQTFNQMNMSNLNRRQQVSLSNAAAQQGLALQNLSNEQQVALQNSTNAFSLQTQDLSNMQQTFLSNAQLKAAFQGQNLGNQQQVNLITAARYAEVANMNLNNRQQTALVNNANNLQVDLSNLSNKQQSYLANAQLAASLQGKQIDIQQQTAMQNAARFSEAANITFSANQQEQLHNSELMKTIGLANLNTSQATTLQNAAQLAGMDMQNLNNRQQAAVQQAQNFLSMNMANLTNEQQTAIFKSQQNIQSLFTDQAADNAAAQFNAANENQTRQFFSSLANQTGQFNAAQTNALNQFNIDEINSIREFNAGIQQQRDQFNATNSLVVAQANAQWRQNLATLNTAAQNESNATFAATINAMTSKNIDAVWQRERDLMSYNYTSAESGKDRALQILMADKELQQLKESIGYAEDTAKTELAFRFLFGDTSEVFTKGIFKLGG